MYSGSKFINEWQKCLENGFFNRKIVLINLISISVKINFQSKKEYIFNKNTRMSAMQYNLKKKHNPANRNQQAKWYATPINRGKISSFQLNRQVILRSKIDKNMVKETANAMSQEITELLSDGYSVNFGTLGTFRVSFSSDGVEKAEEFNPEMIHNIKVIFTPSVEFQKAMKDKIKK